MSQLLRICGVAVLLIVFSSQIVMAAQSAPVYREFKDWLLACDNTLFCDARGYSDDYDGYMRITREGGTEGALTVEIRGDTTLDPKVFLLDGRNLRLRPDEWELDETCDNPMISTALEAAYNFIREILNGRLLELGESCDRDSKSAAVPLDNLVAVISLMDEVQGRNGNQTALIHPGIAPASTIPAPPVPLKLRAVKPVAPLSSAEEHRLIKVVGKQRLVKRCGTHEGARFTLAYALNREEALIMAECERGAYQSLYLLFQVSRGKNHRVKKVPLPLSKPLVDNPYEDGPLDASDGGLNDPRYDPKTATLSRINKFRGPGDCGSWADWRFDGKKFQLASYNYQGSCNGEQNLPTLWRSQ